MKDNYLETTKNIYRQAAEYPQPGLCCTITPAWQLPGLHIPERMQQMNYGCGSTVHQRDLVHKPRVLYVGVGGGMELLQFAYFSRQEGGVTGIDAVDEMMLACRNNLLEAEATNPWFSQAFVSLKKGDALQLPVADKSMDIAAQNCLFNIFRQNDLKMALQEMYRVLKPHGKLILSDPVCSQEIPGHLKNDERLRALCLSGCLPLETYVQLLTATGFGTVEIRARRPYRLLDPAHYATAELIYIESVEICAIKDPMPTDGPCIFTGKAAIYFGTAPFFDDGKGHTLWYNQPQAVCDKTAAALAGLHQKDIFISDSTWFYDGGGCC